jgi:Transposase
MYLMPAPHPQEFRQRAVALARQGDSPVAKIAKDLGISESCLRNWRPDDYDSPLGHAYRCYVHLEYDLQPGQGAELRILLDTGDQLAPVPVVLNQPTLAWSTGMIRMEQLDAAGPPSPGVLEWQETVQRLATWQVWPFAAALLDQDAALTRTAVLDRPDIAVDARGAEVWELTYGRPRHLKPA